MGHHVSAARCHLFLLTKRPERIRAHLPADLGEGWDNIWLNVTCEN